MKTSITSIAFIFMVLSVMIVQARMDRIDLKNVQTLTFTKDKMTEARRVPPISQLKCVNHDQYPNLCQSKYMPTTVQCYNKGTDGKDIQWKCDASLHNHVALDQVHVSCEGYASSYDTHVLHGSCGLTYSLKPTELYRQQQEQMHTSGPHILRHVIVERNENEAKQVEFIGLLAFIIVTVLILAIAYSYCITPCQYDPYIDQARRSTSSPSAPRFDETIPRSPNSAYVHPPPVPPTSVPFVAQPVPIVPVYQADSHQAFYTGVQMGANMHQPTHYSNQRVHHHHYSHEPSLSASYVTDVTIETPSVQNYTSSAFGSTSTR